MTEYTLTRRIMRDFRDHAPAAEVIKHVGTAYQASGIPDLSISLGRPTSWIELKRLRRGEDRADVIEQVQLIFCRRLAVKTDMCWIVFYEDGPPACVTIWDPRALFAHLVQGVAAPAHGWNGRARPLHKCVPLRGFLRVPGWPLDIVRRLVQDASVP